MVFMKKSTPFRHKRYHGRYEYFYTVILFVIQAITNIYDEMVLKIFINTIAKPHVKRLPHLFSVAAYINSCWVFLAFHHV